MTEPTALSQLRHLYQNMVNGAVRDTASAKRIAEGLLAPAIEALERATPPAVAGEPVAWLSTDCIGERYLCFTKPKDSDPARPLVFGDVQAGAVPLTWCTHCGEGVTTFCRSKCDNRACPKGLPGIKGGQHAPT